MCSGCNRALRLPGSGSIVRGVMDCGKPCLDQVAHLAHGRVSVSKIAARFEAVVALLGVLMLVLLVGLITARPAHADDVCPGSSSAPIASCLLALDYTSHGVKVNITNPAFPMAGLANDATTVYMLDGSTGNVVTVALASIDMTAGGTVNVTGTVHQVAWGVDGAPSLPSNLYQLSISYSHGCLFITNGDNSANAKLDCISTSDYTVSDVPVPASYPLPMGYYYTFSSLVAFPDGRIGKVSAYQPDGSGGYTSTLRTYAVAGTGNAASITWSQDYVMADPDNFATDEHGIATDGTYLYRIQYVSHNPNYRSWQLQSGTPASMTYSGQFTQVWPNVHYLSYDPSGHYYLAGFYNAGISSNTGFYITAAADPGPGPGNPLDPTFSGTRTPTDDGYTVQITNYDSSFSWAGIAASGATVAISSTGLVTVSGLARGTSSTATITTTKAGIADGSAAVTATSLAATVPDAPTSTSAIAGDGQATVSWIAPGSDGGSAITGYTVTAIDSSVPGNGGQTVSTSGARSATVTGLTNGDSYAFAVTATNSVGISPASAVSAAVIPMSPPGAPENLATTATDNTISVSFTAPSGASSTITGYQVSTNDGATWITLTTTGSSPNLSGTLTGLTPGTRYQLRVRAISSVGDGTPTAALSVTTLPGTVPAPTATAGTSSATVSWAQSSTSTVTGYIVYASPGPAICTTTAITATSCIIGATTGVSYTYTVIAHSPAGDSTVSSASPAIIASAPQIPTAAPTTAPTTLTTTDGVLTSVTPSQQITVVGKGFLPYSSATIIVYSAPIVLGTAITDANGDFSKHITIPTKLDPGAHNLVASGINPVGVTYLIRMPVILPPAASPANRSLPETGVPVLQLAIWATLAAAAGIVLLTCGRARQR